MQHLTFAHELYCTLLIDSTSTCPKHNRVWKHYKHDHKNSIRLEIDFFHFFCWQSQSTRGRFCVHTKPHVKKYYKHDFKNPIRFQTIFFLHAKSSQFVDGSVWDPFLPPPSHSPNAPQFNLKMKYKLKLKLGLVWSCRWSRQAWTCCRVDLISN